MQYIQKALILFSVGVHLVFVTSVHSQTTPKQLSEEAYIQRVDDLKLKENFKSIMLGDVIEQGLRKNHKQQIREEQDSLLEINWDDAYKSFWFPQLNLTLTTSEYRVGQLYNGSKDDGATSTSPTGSLGLQFDNYTLFNWGKDYLTYLNTKESYLRNKKILKEQRRELKHDLIEKFFETLTYQKIEENYKSKLRHASFIYRLNRERIATGKINNEQFYQARSAYLNAQSEYQAAKVESQLADEELAYLISDPVGTRYFFRENLKYQPLRLRHEESVELASRTNPNILNARVEVENSRRSYELQRRENLPLPKFTLNIGGYKHRFGQSQSTTSFETGTDNSNIEIVASINATWSIFGSGGLLNANKTQGALIDQNIALKTLGQYGHKTQSDIRKQYRKILIYQKQIEILDPRIKALQKTFDTILENYINKKTRYNDFGQALEDLTQAQVELSQARLNHLKEKIKLADIIGIEDLPGESFEKLASFNAEDGLNE